MKLTKTGRVFVLLLLLAALFSCLVVVPYYFPFLGISLSLIIFAVFSYKNKQKKTVYTKTFLIFCLLFSSAIIFRSEGLLTFFNVVAALYFGSLMMLVEHKKDLTILKVALAPFFLIFKGLFTSSKYELEFKEKPKNILGSMSNITEKTAVVVITLFILAVVPALLAQANPIFANRLEALYQLFDLNRFLDLIFNIDNILLFQRLLFFFILLLLLPRMVTYMNKKNKDFIQVLKGRFDLDLTVPKALTVVILLLFFVTQYQLYFSSKDTLTGLGYTYSEYTNEVFGQLSVVSLIVIWLMYVENKKNKYSQILNYLLILQGIFLSFMAFKSDYEYSYNFGFTYKRLYGFAVFALMLGIFLFQFRALQKQVSKNRLVYHCIVYSGLILFAVNLLNFDYLIYHYRKSTTGQGVDYHYLSRLSPDSLSFDEQIKNLEVKFRQAGQQDKYQFIDPANILLHKIEALQKKYNNSQLRAFNLLEYSQYKQVESVNVAEYRGIFDVNQEPGQTPIQNPIE